MKFRKGQTVYFFEKTSDYAGHIVAGIINGATKDLITGQIVYKVDSNGFLWPNRDAISGEYLYKNYKKVFNEHKDEIAYFDLIARIKTLEDAVNKVFTDYAEKIQAAPNWGVACNLVANDKPSIQIEGIGDLQEEFNKLKNEVTDLKKKIKKPTKKPVIKEKKEKEAVGI